MKKNLLVVAANVLVAVLGIALIVLSMKAVGFRVEGGYSVVSHQFVALLQILVAEWVSGIAGTILLGIGAIGVYNNSRKLMR